MSEHARPISVQLYTLREQATVDFPAVLRRIGEIGYVGVELAGLYGLSPVEFRAIADDSGLRVSSGHVSPDLDALPKALDDLLACGSSTAVIAFLPPERFASVEEVARSAELINRANELATAQGVTLGYHNHFWEFQQSFDGQTAWSLLFDQLHPAVIAELDIYWATLGGADPVAVGAELGPRLRLAHVKDGPADDAKAPMVAVGAGAVDLPRVLTSTNSLEWHIVELDRCATDMFTAVEDSYRYLVGNHHSTGRNNAR